MANKEVKPKARKLSKEEREHIDNQTVLATAIGLISAVVLAYLWRWFNSSAAAGTMLFTKILMWLCDAGILASLIVYFVKKNPKAIRFVPYFAGGAFLLSTIVYSGAYRKLLDWLHINDLLAKMGVATENTMKLAFIFVYICIAIYLIATYIYLGCKVKRGKQD